MRERDPLIEHLESLTDQSAKNLRREADKRLYSSVRKPSAKKSA
jgi:hypothetical protein